MPHFQTYTLKGDHTAKGIQVSNFTELPNALDQLGLQSNQPTLVLVGGAKLISSADYELVQQLFFQVVVPVVEQSGAAVLDGGTDSGIMQLIGYTRASLDATFPLVGVAPIGKVKLPELLEEPNANHSLAPHHTHFILVPGNNFGDESPWLARISSLLSEGFPSCTLVINGGRVTLMDVANSIQEGHPTLLLEGSGRTADRLASALNQSVDLEGDEQVKEMVASGLLQTIDLKQSFEVTTDKLLKLLTPH
ncbi:MAG: hypothetical protein AB4426_10865 [Xenococcaceae cyanobacterium]